MIIKTLGNIVNKAPAPYVSRQQGIRSAFKKQSASTEGLQAYSSVSTLFAVVSHLANDTSAVEWKLYQKKVDSRRSYASEEMDSRKEIAVHPVLNLLNKPNSFMTRQEFFEIIQQHIDLAGEAFILVSKAMGVPYELWPYRPDMMRVVASRDNYISGYVAVTPDGDEIPFETDEVIHLRMPNPMNPFRGISPVAAMLTDLDSYRLGSEFNRTFFMNDATPNGIIIVPAGITNEAFERMVMRWNEQHRGVHNSNKTAFIEEGKWQSVASSMKDMQFVELRNVAKETILEAFAFPKFKLGIVQDVNRATAEASEYSYAKGLLVPRLERIKQALNNDLLPLFKGTAKNIELDYCSPVPEDEATELQSTKTKIESAIMLIDAGFDPVEVLNAFGLPAIPFTRGGTNNEQVV